MNLQERYQSKTPKFFRKLRNIGLGITAGAGALLSAPISLPAGIITAVGYLAVAGTTVSAVSQAVIKDEEEECEKSPENNQRPTRTRSESDENTS